jgi:hypothetical protein
MWMIVQEEAGFDERVCCAFTATSQINLFCAREALSHLSASVRACD